ncbi:MAG: hypothetical protein V4697_01720 [Patescibacteria group bacterium]
MQKIFGVLHPQTFSDILRDIAQVLFAALVVEQIIKQEMYFAILSIGISTSLLFWVASIIITSKYTKLL